MEQKKLVSEIKRRAGANRVLERQKTRGRDADLNIAQLREKIIEKFDSVQQLFDILQHAYGKNNIRGREWFYTLVNLKAMTNEEAKQSFILLAGANAKSVSQHEIRRKLELEAPINTVARL